MFFRSLSRTTSGIACAWNLNAVVAGHAARLRLGHLDSSGGTNAALLLLLTSVTFCCAGLAATAGWCTTTARHDSSTGGGVAIAIAPRWGRVRSLSPRRSLGERLLCIRHRLLGGVRGGGSGLLRTGVGGTTNRIIPAGVGTRVDLLDPH